MADTTDINKLPRPKVKLTGTNGNAYSVIGTTAQTLRKAGWTREQLHAFQVEAMGGDYDHVLATCMKYADVR